RAAETSVDSRSSHTPAVATDAITKTAATIHPTFRRDMESSSTQGGSARPLTLGHRRAAASSVIGRDPHHRSHFGEGRSGVRFYGGGKSAVTARRACRSPRPLRGVVSSAPKAPPRAFVRPSRKRAQGLTPPRRR